MSTAWSGKNRNGWYYIYQRRAKDFLARNRLDNCGRCTLRIEGVCTTTATQVHHVLGINVSKLDENYWAASCGPCNQRIGDPSKHSPPCTPTTAFD